MFRKPFYLMLCILFLVAILAACAKPPQASEMATTTIPTQVPELVASAIVLPQNTAVVETPTFIPQETEIIALPTDVWHLLILGHSTLFNLGKAYASQIEEDIGVKVVLEDYAVAGLSIGELLNALKNEAPIRSDLSGLSAAISKSEVIVLFVYWPEGSIIPENPWNMDRCMYSPGMPYFDTPTNCNPAGREKFITDLKWIWGEIFRLRNGKPTILRTMDLYNPWVSIWNEKDEYLDCTRCWENISNSIRIVAEAYHIPFVHCYDAYNGVNHDVDPREKGYILSDGTHPTDLAQQVTAELLAQMGYEPVPPP